MAQHKAPTSITIAPTSEKSGMAEFVDRYWKIALIVALVMVGTLLYRQSTKGHAEEVDAQAWDKLIQKTNPDPTTGVLSGKVDDLVGVADEIKESHAAPFALYLAASSAAGEHKYDEAKKLLGRLRAEYPTSKIVVDKLGTTAPGPKQSAVEKLESHIDAQIAWRSQNPALFGLPELPADAPKVKINTDRGVIVVGLYTKDAPLHAEAFLKLAREGGFNGMKFHRVVPDRAIQSGDPNTLKEDVATWGAGETGPAPAAEPTALKHFTGALSSARMLGSKTNSGSQFMIALADDHTLDADTFVFGKVIEGMDIAKAISESSTVAGTDRPEQPATIQSTEVQ
jgi:peptidyl-prolyl cis-trans isomerase B (cyclophilin B)